jgi:uncharacterized membrane protein YgaE (UPF0421/DUF939 family)
MALIQKQDGKPLRRPFPGISQTAGMGGCAGPGIPAGFPVSAQGMAVLIGIGTIVLTLLGRPEDIITTGITTAVVMIVAGISPRHAWIQSILRLVDTVVGIGVGIVAGRISLMITSDIDLTKLKGNAQQAAEKSISSEIATLSD